MKRLLILSLLVCSANLVMAAQTPIAFQFRDFAMALDAYIQQPTVDKLAKVISNYNRVPATQKRIADNDLSKRLGRTINQLQQQLVVPPPAPPQVPHQIVQRAPLAQPVTPTPQQSITKPSQSVQKEQPAAPKPIKTTQAPALAKPSELSQKLIVAAAQNKTDEVKDHAERHT